MDQQWSLTKLDIYKRGKAEKEEHGNCVSSGTSLTTFLYLFKFITGSES